MRCPEFVELIDFLDGRLDYDSALQIEQHIASGCHKCVAKREWHLRFRSLCKSDGRFSPPEWAWQRAITLFETERRRKPFEAARLSEIALLSHDSFRHAAYAGARSAADSHRQLLYTAADYSIDLQIAPTEPSGAEVIGQVLREDDAGFGSVAEILVDLNTRGETAWSTVTNDVGEFMFIGVDFGDYDLLVDTRDIEIKVPDVPVSL